MKVYSRKLLSSLIVIAIFAAPIELALGNECHCADKNHPAQISCECFKTQNSPSKPACCRDSSADSSQDASVKTKSESKTNDHQSCTCRCAFMINSTAGIVVDNANTHLDVVITIPRYLPDTYHVSDWVSSILRPPIC